jgi:hypothetical protein
MLAKLTPTAYSLQPTAYSLQPTAYSLQPTAYRPVARACEAIYIAETSYYTV